MSGFPDVEFVTAVDASQERPDDTVIFALPRGLAMELLQHMQGLSRDTPAAPVLTGRTARALADRIQASYLADRALVASDLGLSFTVCRHIVHLAERWSGGLLTELEAKTFAVLAQKAGRGLAEANLNLKRAGAVPQLWKMVESRVESLN